MAKHARCQALCASKEQMMHWGGLRTRLQKAVVQPEYLQLEEAKTMLG